jgi:hypothetical protein
VTGITKEKLVKYGIIGLSLFLFFFIDLAILAALLGVAYPVFMSLYAL